MRANQPDYEGQVAMEKVGLSASGSGVQVWLGDAVQVTLTWDQAAELRDLLTEATAAESPQKGH